MWPSMNYQEKKIEMVLIEHYRSDDISEDTRIKEIAMIYAPPFKVSYNPDEIALVAYYDCDYGLHTILFSKVQDVKYEIDEGIMQWTATFTSNKESTVHDDGNYVDEDTLTAMFKDTLSTVQVITPSEALIDFDINLL